MIGMLIGSVGELGPKSGNFGEEIKWLDFREMERD
jgi:hypothetical protein